MYNDLNITVTSAVTALTVKHFSSLKSTCLLQCQKFVNCSFWLLFERGREKKNTTHELLLFVKFLIGKLQRGAAYSYTRIVRFHAKTYVSLRKNLRI